MEDCAALFNQRLDELASAINDLNVASNRGEKIEKGQSSRNIKHFINQENFTSKIDIIKRLYRKMIFNNNRVDSLLESNDKFIKENQSIGVESNIRHIAQDRAGIDFLTKPEKNLYLSNLFCFYQY